MRCQICGKQISSDIEIIDPIYAIKDGKAKVCSDCFKDWVSSDNNRLMDKIHRKLRGGGTYND